LEVIAQRNKCVKAAERIHNSTTENNPAHGLRTTDDHRIRS